MKCQCRDSKCTGRLDVDIEGRMIIYSNDKETNGVYISSPTELAEFIHKLKELYHSFIEN